MHYRKTPYAYLCLVLIHIDISRLIQTLTTLNLQSNKISIKGATYLADALTRNHVRISSYSSLSSLTHIRHFFSWISLTTQLEMQEYNI